MKIAVIGATGFVGRQLVNELISRGYEVDAIARHPEQLETHVNLYPKAVDIHDQKALVDALQGADVVVSAFNAGWTNPNLYADFLEGSLQIEKAVKQVKAARYVVIGGAGSLYVNGAQLVDSPEFPADIKPGATAARDYLHHLKEEKELNWTFFSPAIEMHPGITSGKTGQYRLGLEEPVFNAERRSLLSVQDLAVVIADEIAHPAHERKRFTAAY